MTAKEWLDKNNINLSEYHIDIDYNICYHTIVINNEYIN